MSSLFSLLGINESMHAINHVLHEISLAATKSPLI